MNEQNTVARSEMLRRRTAAAVRERLSGTAWVEVIFTQRLEGGEGSHVVSVERAAQAARRASAKALGQESHCGLRECRGEGGGDEVLDLGGSGAGQQCSDLEPPRRWSQQDWLPVSRVQEDSRVGGGCRF